jgi:hypothetical protein
MDMICSKRSFRRCAGKKGTVGRTTALKSGIDAAVHHEGLPKSIKSPRL